MRYSSFEIFSLITCCVCLLTVQAQVKDSIADALKLQIEEATSDTLRINLKLDLSGRVALFNMDEAIAIVKDVEEDIKNIDKNSSFYKKTKGTVLRSLANAETTKENWANALDYQFQTVKHYIKINDSIGLGIAYTGLSSIYLKLEDLLASEKYIRKALKIQKYNSTPDQYAYSYIKLGHIYFAKKELDSAVIAFNKAKKIDTTKQRALIVESNLSSVYKAQNKYEKVLEINKRTLKLTNPKDFNDMGVRYGNLAHTYGLLEDWNNALKAVDSCIYFYESIGKKRQLELAYNFKADCLHNLGRYKEAYNAQAIYKIYSDSVNNLEEHKRITKLDLNYKFNKEREIADLKLQNEASKKQLYLVLLVVALLSGALIIFFIRKNTKQKLSLKEAEKLNADLALANRETELKKVVIENSLKEEVIKQTIDEVKNVIAINDKTEREQALKSIRASLLSEQSSQKTTSTLQSYLDKTSIDFKVLLDSEFSQLNANEKQLLSLMKLDLNATEISKLTNTTVAAVKSSRYRIRKKLNLDSKADIIAFLETKKN
ncbi:tetratricopeptide repeat protein [Winogradskyella jejuensis]|uniref:Tetratricopeptide repeat-containing protein n=1 Tax=Winogradskyella jejuensis TaxID=1089305 RepID=A0A1M5MDN6_9FLAO|nr:hypothetical protein [Winogradskyella jejuensis]SHG75321.1 Tetratricopeptide repeat-containing protein [Winogradskyella jejuensis]